MPSPIHPEMGERVIYDSGLPRHAKVATIIHGGEWRCPPANSTELLTLKDAILYDLTPHMEEDDMVVWALTSSGVFSIKSAWMAIRRSSPPICWDKLVWFHGNIPRASFILWLACKGKLSTHDRYRLPQEAGSCLLCNLTPESHHHLFFECPFSMQIWHNILRKGNVQFHIYLGITKLCGYPPIGKGLL